MDMKSTKFLAVMVLGLGLVAGASAQTNTIDTYVIGQDVQGELTTEATVSHDYYYEDFDVTQVYGQWAVLDITDVNADDPTNLTADEIDRANIVKSGNWQDLQDTSSAITGTSFADYGANDTATESVSFSHNFNVDSPDTGEYALLTVMATADSIYDADANQTSGEGWSQSSAEWVVPSGETYDYEDGNYGIKEVDRTTYSFQVIEAEEPQGVGSAFTGFFDDIFGGIVETITGFFDSGELGVPNPETPPSP